jgi:hypothetical protein
MQALLYLRPAFSLGFPVMYLQLYGGIINDKRAILFLQRRTVIVERFSNNGIIFHFFCFFHTKMFLVLSVPSKNIKI